MQKLVIIRGHSGSGKTTFAKHLIADFTKTYPTGHCFHIENDLFLVNEQGQYEWTESRFQQAKLQAQQAVNNAFKFAKLHVDQDVLIVISNVGIHRKTIFNYIQQAEKQYMQSEIYRLQSFYQNQHQLDNATVQNMFEALNRNPIRGEIILP